MMKTLVAAALLATAFAVPAMADAAIPAKNQGRFGELREKHGAHPYHMNHHTGKIGATHVGKYHGACAKKASNAATPEYAKWELEKCQGKVKTWKATKGKPFHKTLKKKFS